LSNFTDKRSVSWHRVVSAPRQTVALAQPDYSSLSYAELVDLAKTRGIKPSFPKASKANLIAQLSDA